MYVFHHTRLGLVSVPVRSRQSGCAFYGHFVTRLTNTRACRSVMSVCFDEFPDMRQRMWKTFFSILEHSNTAPSCVLIRIRCIGLIPVPVLTYTHKLIQRIRTY